MATLWRMDEMSHLAALQMGILTGLESVATEETRVSEIVAALLATTTRMMRLGGMSAEQMKAALERAVDMGEKYREREDAVLVETALEMLAKTEPSGEAN